jgi:hypothetical protein
MGNQARQLLEAALALPRNERADLAEQLLASVEDEVADADMFGEAEPDPEVEKAWAAEVVQRLERIASGETVLVDGQAVHGRLRDRFGSK